MKEYTKKKEELTEELKANNQNLLKFTNSELIKVINSKATETYKESEKVRKQYSKNEISVDDFIKNYLGMRAQFHEIEHKK